MMLLKKLQWMFGSKVIIVQSKKWLYGKVWYHDNSKFRAKMQFLSWKIGSEETNINSLHVLEQKANDLS